MSINHRGNTDVALDPEPYPRVQPPPPPLNVIPHVSGPERVEDVDSKCSPSLCSISLGPKELYVNLFGREVYTFYLHEPSGAWPNLKPRLRRWLRGFGFRV